VELSTTCDGNPPLPGYPTTSTNQRAFPSTEPSADVPFRSGLAHPDPLLMYARRRRIVRRMPRVQVYLPEDLHEQLKQRDLPASELLQVALRAELERQDALAETDRYLEELAAEVGEPSQRQQATADAIARRIRDRSLDRVG